MSGIVKGERIGGQRLILGDCLEVMPLLFVLLPSTIYWYSYFTADKHRQQVQYLVY